MLDTPRASFLRRQLRRDVDAEVALGVDRAYLEGVIADARAELEHLENVARRRAELAAWQPTAADLAQMKREERDLARAYRAAARRGAL